MKHSEKDCRILRHMVAYCEQIELTIERFGNDYETFASDQIYRNAVALCVLQIGELVSLLSDELKDAYRDIPWRQIKGMRNIVAHHYGSVDAETTWETIQDDVPVLKEKCLTLLAE